MMNAIEKSWPKGLAKKSPAEQMKWSIANDLMLPPFLYFTAEQRKAAWKNVPLTVPQASSFVEAKAKADEARKAIADEAKLAKAKKAKARVANLANPVDLSNMRWDPRKGKFVPDLGDPAKPIAGAPPAPAAGGAKGGLGSVLEVDALVKIAVKENPRQPGTGAFKRFAELMKYMKKHPKATVGEVLEKTGYRKDDYLWDLKRGNVK